MTDHVYKNIELAGSSSTGIQDGGLPCHEIYPPSVSCRKERGTPWHDNACPLCKNDS